MNFKDIIILMEGEKFGMVYLDAVSKILEQFMSQHMEIVSIQILNTKLNIILIIWEDMCPKEKKNLRNFYLKRKRVRERQGGGVAIIGDSVAMGFGVNDEQVYSNIIQKEIDIPVFNLAVESFATERELLRLYNSDIKDKVKIIIINYHGNDLGENKLKLDSEYYYNESVKWANQGSTIPKTLGYRQALRDLLLKFKFSLLTPPKLLINYFFQKKLDPLLNNFDEDFTEHKFYLKKVLQNHNDYLKDKYIIILYSNEWGNRFDNYPSGFDSELKNVLFFDVNLTRNDFYFLDDHPNKNGHYSIGKKLSLLINTFNEIK